MRATNTKELKSYECVAAMPAWRGLLALLAVGADAPHAYGHAPRLQPVLDLGAAAAAMAMAAPGRGAACRPHCCFVRAAPQRAQARGAAATCARGRGVPARAPSVVPGPRS